MDAAGVFFNPGALGNGAQVVLLVHGADAPGHAAVVRHGFVQPVAHHAVAVRVGGVGQKLVNGLVGGAAIVVVGVDHGEGGIPHGLSGADHRMAGAEGLHPAFGDGVAFRQLFQLLIGVADFHGALGQPLAHGGHEVLPDGLLDEDHCRAEACLVGVIKGVVQNGLPMGAHRVDLLQAAIPAAHSRSQNHKYRCV